jgi:hypothetical protein
LIDTDRFLSAAPPEGILRRRRSAHHSPGRLPSMRANGLSMMLEELEVDPDPQGMANLLAYQQTPRQVISGSSVL